MEPTRADKIRILGVDGRIEKADWEIAGWLIDRDYGEGAAYRRSSQGGEEVISLYTFRPTQLGFAYRSKLTNETAMGRVWTALKWIVGIGVPLLAIAIGKELLK